VPQRLDERPLVADRLMQLLLGECPRTVDGGGPARLEDRPGLAKALGVDGPHLCAVRVPPVELGIDERSDVYAVDADIHQSAVDVDIPQVDTPQARVEDRAAAHIRAPQEHSTQLAAREVVVLPFEHGASLSVGVRTGRPLLQRPRALRVPLTDTREQSNAAYSLDDQPHISDAMKERGLRSL